MALSPTILTLDLGTTALKATLFDLDGDVLAAAQTTFPTRRPRPGWAEQDAQEWWQATVSATRQVVRAAAAPVPALAGVGLTSQREGVVPVDERGEPVAACIIWMDRRAQPEAEALGREFPDLHRRTGMRPEATFTAAKVRWLARHEPETLRRARWLLQPRDFLYFRLTGVVLTDPSLASRTMLYDLRARAWAPDLVAAAGASPDQLPPVLPSLWAPGRLTAEAAGALGLPEGTPVVVGGGDRACEALGTGARPGRAMESTGTTTNLSLPAEGLPEVPDGILVSLHVVPGQVLLEQGLSASGAALEWVRVLAGLTVADLDEVAPQSPPGARGLRLLPHFHGARAPWWDPAARAVWSGFTLAHDRPDLVRSVLEAVACEVRGCLEVLRASGQRVEEVVLAGGGARSRVWAAIKAHTWRLPVLLPRVTEAASLGAMVLAAAGLGLRPLEEAAALNPPVGRIDPDPALAAQYDRVYAEHRALYQRMRGVV